ncbi:thiol peroxidase [Parenemella sanctibonifatiensis]|uniref:Thiol peroxidase n=1 Tax=Parenemella sanctibonifatiensis TaxID=2016505 RepID=A0A255E915_9ACTN|nr:thiol peroxidase [Parenemella sanctibonifatiensis]OYN88049.1 lipid hydroperoxide peroxidase [Parenemella sanctibonifatiensis]OYN89396.1 lipid hydroperoxide peroxidase [Parenemella sanctibonifatiensis]
MATTAFKGSEVHTVGELPTGAAPSFTLVGTDLADVTLDSFAGKRVVLNIFPSLDTGTCAASVRRFNELAADLADTVVLCVSNDLPFAQARFCGAEGIENVVTASGFRSSFGDDYGVKLVDGPLAGLLTRTVIVIDASGQITYTQLVPEITDEPDYDAVLAELN